MKALIAIVTALACLLVGTLDSHSQEWGVVKTSASVWIRTKHVPPVMPQVAIDSRIEGFVEIAFTIATDGTVKDLKVIDARPLWIFEEAALAAVSQWTYRVEIRNGEPIEQRAMVRVNFKLPEV
jgi:TonB family protein